MSVFIAGGTGFIGRRLTRSLIAEGETVTVMDIAPQTADFKDLGDKVNVVQGDISQFDVVMDRMAAAEADRVINLAYFIGNHRPPHVALKLNIDGMDNFFEAARLTGAKRVVYASSLAVYGLQKHYGERAVNETDFKHGDNQYAVHKIFNEWQAQDYREKFGMSITGVRPTNVSGPDKIFGSIDHVQCVVRPARGEAAKFPYSDYCRLPIHVDDITEIFQRVLMANDPKHDLYNSGGTTISMGDLAQMVRGYLPEANIQFEHETGGKDASGVYLMDNSRLVDEFGVQLRPWPERVLQIINTVRAEEGKEPVGR
ncbi:MAG: NAD(P)-dependent oxidoreductase [Pseudomonadota bacterium]|nr:NAD(P)-dependent oxidoreductase [Pseudomonadota bacterium]